jgi:hypothetical protein
MYLSTYFYAKSKTDGRIIKAIFVGKNVPPIGTEFIFEDRFIAKKGEMSDGSWVIDRFFTPEETREAQIAWLERVAPLEEGFDISAGPPFLDTERYIQSMEQNKST